MIRKRKTITITSILIISLLLSGCKTTEIINNKLDFYSSNRSQSSTTIQKSAEELEQKEENSIPKYIQGKNIKYYAFEQLNEKQISLYQDIYSVIEGQSEGMTFDASEYTQEDIADMFRAVMTDHPELFYTTSYKLVKNYKNEELLKVINHNNHICEDFLANLFDYKKKLATVGGNILGTTQNMGNDYEKIKFFYIYLIHNAVYDIKAINSQNIVSALIDKETVCQGYSKAFEYLCQKSGINCTLVTGRANGQAHSWNYVECEGRGYWVDVTWGTSDYSGAVNFENFMITDDEIKKTHEITSELDLKECNSNQYNYYIQEGLYLEEYDYDTVKSYADQCMKNNDFITFKCKNFEVFSNSYQDLFQNEKIFDILPDIENVEYSLNEDLYVINVYV